MTSLTNTLTQTRISWAITGIQIGFMVRVVQKLEISSKDNNHSTALVAASIFVMLNISSGFYWGFADRLDMPIALMGILDTICYLVEILSAGLISYLIYIRYQIFTDLVRNIKVRQFLIIFITLLPQIVRLFIFIPVYACGREGYVQCNDNITNFAFILYDIGSVLNILYRLYYDWYFLRKLKSFLNAYKQSANNQRIIRFNYSSYAVEILLTSLCLVYLAFQIAGINLIGYFDPFKLCMSYAMLNIVELKHMVIAIFGQHEEMEIQDSDILLTAVCNDSSVNSLSRQDPMRFAS